MSKTPSKTLTTEYGTPPDLSEHLSVFETSAEQDEVLKAWSDRRTQRMVSQQELAGMDSAHKRIDALVSKTDMSLSAVKRSISKFNVDITASESTSSVDNDKAFGAKRPARRMSLKNLLTKKRSVVMVTTGAQTQIQSLDLDVIRHTADELTICQDAQEMMVEHFSLLKIKWVKVANHNRRLQCDYNKVVTEACSTCAMFQQELHLLAGQVASLELQCQHKDKEKDGLRAQLVESTRIQNGLRLEAEATVLREEATLNKVAFMEDENNYMREELEQARENCRLLRLEYRTLEEDREQLMTEFVESRLKQSEVVAKYLDELQEREEERREFIRASGLDSGYSMEQLLRDSDRQAELTEERNNLTEEVELLNTKCIAQDLHIEGLLQQLADLAKVVDSYESYNARVSMTDAYRPPPGVHTAGSYSRALGTHRMGTGTGSITNVKIPVIEPKTDTASKADEAEEAESDEAGTSTAKTKSILKKKSTMK